MVFRATKALGAVFILAIFGTLAYFAFVSFRDKKSFYSAVIDGVSYMARGIRNNNPGNIRINPANKWVGKVANNTDGAFEQFTAPEYGIRALDITLTNYAKRGLVTIRQIISTWAPAGDDNDTESYIRAVSNKTGVDPDSYYPRSREARINLARAIIKHENGIDPYSDEIMRKAIV